MRSRVVVRTRSGTIHKGRSNITVQNANEVMDIARDVGKLEYFQLIDNRGRTVFIHGDDISSITIEPPRFIFW